ncbi:ATPase [Sneathia vaginalis]|uniref:ATPase n=2 Tax=Sneathia TaxID=168808 RepID=UPI0009FE92D4|nr:ATPase [Sneathia vaginalis]
MYVQVTESMKNESVRERELKPLQKIHNNYKKMVITLDKVIDDEYDGIQSIDIIEWLLK